MFLLTVLVMVLFFCLITFALCRKKHVRATFKGPLSAFVIELEADDQNCDPIDKKHSIPAKP